MSIGSVGSTPATLYSDKLFAQLDTKRKGYLEEADLAKMVDPGDGSGSSSAGVKALFSAMDTDGDGKVTESELSSTLTSLAEALMQDLRLSSRGPGSEPPGPTAPPEGATKDQMTAMAADLSSSDPRASLINQLVENFDAADADGDGKVSAAEAHAFTNAGRTAAAPDQSLDGSPDAESARFLTRLAALLNAYASQRDSAADDSGNLIASA